MDITSYILITEAVTVMGVQRHHIARLCREGKLPGAVKMGENWLIPRASAEAYQPGPKGFAAHPESNPRKRNK